MLASNTSVAYNDVYLSTVSFGDAMQLARHCISGDTILIPAKPGLQCWPPNVTCSTSQLNGTSQQQNYSLVFSLLQTDSDIALQHNITMSDAANTSNLYITHDQAPMTPTDNLYLWANTDSRVWGKTIFSSTRWSAELITNRPNDSAVDGVRYTQIASTFDYACALTSTGSVRCWGSDWYVAWPRCYGAVCLLYGNLCNGLSCNNEEADLHRPYTPFNAPTQYEPYTHLCVTSAYACAISHSATHNQSIICWMGLYGLGAPLVRWIDIVQRPADVSVCLYNAVLDSYLCPAPLVKDSTAFNRERFASLRCSQFTVCGLTVGGSALCSSLPVGTDLATEDIITNSGDIPLTQLGQSQTNNLCGILSNGAVRCTPSSLARLGPMGPFIADDTQDFAPAHQYRIGGGITLANCSNGAYSDRIGSLNALCSGACAAGYVGTNDSVRFEQFLSHQCVSECPAGSWCPQGSSSPEPCAVGTFGPYSRLTSSSECRQCALGSFCPSGSAYEPPCPVGKYCANSSITEPCPPGRYGNETGLTTLNCSGPCAKGFLCTENSVNAYQQSCPAGTYNDAEGKSECRLCVAGYYSIQNLNGTKSCLPCDVGKHAPFNGSTQCLYCPPGKYTDEIAQADCRSCPAGQFTRLTNGVQECAECPAATFSFQEAASGCQACPVNTYSLIPGTVNCSSCAGIDGLNCQSGIAYVASTHHGSIKVSRSSTDKLILSLHTQPCPDGYCTGTNSTQFNYTELITFIRAQDKGHDGDVAPIYLSLANQCSADRDQSASSPLCGACRHGYAPSDIGDPYTGCVPCDGVSALKLFLLIAVSALFVFVYYIAANGRLGLVGTFLYFIQTIVIMASSQSSFTAWFRTFGYNPINLLHSKDCLAPVSVELQYVIPLFIVPMQLVQLFLIVLCHFVIKRWLVKPSTYELNPFTMTYSLTVAQSVVYEREVHFPSFAWWNILIRYRFWPELTVSTVCRTIYLILIASFTSVMLTCVSWFRCTDNIAVGLSAAPGSVIYAFPAISCTSQSYFAWSFLVAGYITVWLTAIVVIVILLIRYRQQIMNLQRRNPVTSTSAITPSLPLKPLVSMVLIPHARLNTNISTSLYVPFLNQTGFAMYWPLTVNRLLNDDDDNALDAKSLNHPVCPVADIDVDCPPMESKREYAFRSVFGAVFDSFNPSAIGWNVLILIRRLVLIVLSVTLTIVPSVKYMSFAFLHLLICGLHVYYEPFALSQLNQIELIAIIVHLLMAIILTAYPTTTETALQTTLLTLTIAPLMSIIIYYIVRSKISIISNIYSEEYKDVNIAEPSSMTISLLSSTNEIECTVINHNSSYEESK